jgi:hypothetical protein
MLICVNTNHADISLYRMFERCHFKRTKSVKQLFVLAFTATVVGWLGAGCEEQAGPQTAKDRTAQRTNRAARAAQRKSRPAKATNEIRAGTIGYLDAKNGFRDVTFGQSETSITDLVEATRDEARQLKTCMRSGETMSLHGVPLERVEYRFYRGELYAIQLDWKIEHADSAVNQPPTTDISIYCAQEFGKPRSSRVSKDGTHYVWHGRRVEIVLSESLLPGVADPAKRDSWALPPTTTGRMLIRNLLLSRAAQAGVASHPMQTTNGL